MSYGDGGFTFGEDSPEAPGDPAPLWTALEPAGSPSRSSPPRPRPTSIESAGLKITQVQQLGEVPQRVSFIVGRVSARIAARRPPSRRAACSIPSPQPVPAARPEPAAAPAPTLAEPPTIEPVIEDDPGFDLGAESTTLPDLALPPIDTAAPAPDPAATPAPRVAEPAPRVALAAPASVGKGLRDDDWSGLYLALGLVAALLAGGSFAAGRARRPSAATASVLQLPNR